MNERDAAALDTAEFGFPGELRERLVRAILEGEKTSTSSLLIEYGLEENLPVPGDRSAVVDSDGRRVAVIETTEVRVVPFSEVDLAFAREEGEGFASVVEWRRAHRRFWESEQMREALGLPEFRVAEDTAVVAERFRLVARIDGP